MFKWIWIILALYISVWQRRLLKMTSREINVTWSFYRIRYSLRSVPFDVRKVQFNTSENFVRSILFFTSIMTLILTLIVFEKCDFRKTRNGIWNIWIQFFGKEIFRVRSCMVHFPLCFNLVPKFYCSQFQYLRFSPYRRFLKNISNYFTWKPHQLHFSNKHKIFQFK